MCTYESLFSRKARDLPKLSQTLVLHLANVLIAVGNCLKLRELNAIGKLHFVWPASNLIFIVKAL